MSAVTAQAVKELRDKTGAGMMECKQALTEANGDMEKAIEYLRKKGIKDADKKASRETKEGAIGHYIHSNMKIGVLLEVTCETDFVARGDEFQGFLKDVCMHIAAMKPLALSREEISATIVARERSIYENMDDVKAKPEKVRPKIIDGKMDKFFKEKCLLEQEFVKDPKITIKELLQSKIAIIKENIVIKRFIRFELGESQADGAKS
ncbi:MAG: translation elongation factor Ts [Planctomycetota bacterium]